MCQAIIQNFPVNYNEYHGNTSTSSYDTDVQENQITPFN